MAQRKPGDQPTISIIMHPISMRTKRRVRQRALCDFKTLTCLPQCSGFRLLPRHLAPFSSAQMSSVDKGGWSAETSALALHRDSLSRMLSVAGLPGLSTEQSRLFKRALTGQGSSKSGSSSGGLEERRPRAGALDPLAFDVLPNWHQVHNPRCKSCDNALFLGINCFLEWGGGAHCLNCTSHGHREEPNAQVKRAYRSIRSRQKEKRSAPTTQQPALCQQRTDRVEVAELPAVSTLQQRATILKKRAKGEKRKLQEPVAASDPVVDGTQGKARLSKQTTKPVGTNFPDNRESRGQEKDALRQLLAQKRARKDKSAATSSQRDTGGLQEFLGSI